MKRFSALPRSRSRDQTRADPPNREAGKKSLSAHFKVAPLVGAALLALAMRPASAEVFTIGGTFTDVGGNSPGSFSQAVTFAPGTTSLDGGALSLNISIVPVGDAAQDEWVVFDYQTTTGNPLSQPSQNWSLSQNGLPAAVPGKFVGDFTQFLNSTGTPFNQTNSIFGQTLMSNPVPGGTGNGEGTLGFSALFPAGPVFDLGAFSDPFSIVTSALGSTQVFGFVQALEFAPQTPIPPSVPEPASLVVLGSAVLGFGAIRRGVRKPKV